MSTAVTGTTGTEGDPAELGPTERSERGAQWASTMGGYLSASDERSLRGNGAALKLAHKDSAAKLGAIADRDRLAREELEELLLVPGATRSVGGGNRAIAEEPDPRRTCFERDRDRILHSSAFRRLAGKTQVFVFPDDHQRTRLTHALEVAQVATAIATAIGVNVALTEAIALGHDCGHGPGGHASEDAFTPYIPGGYDHALWGADTVLKGLNLCLETSDGIRNHSWSRPAPRTPEGEVVSWADRIAYVCHDFEDAVRAGIVTVEDLPLEVRRMCGDRRSQQLNSFIVAVVSTVKRTGQIGMDDSMAGALATFRRFNYERVYMRQESVAQSDSVIRVLRALVEYHAANPDGVPRTAVELDRDDNETSSEPKAAEPKTAATEPAVPEPNSAKAFLDAVSYVGGMTDQYAFNQATRLLSWPKEQLPVGIST